MAKRPKLTAGALGTIFTASFSFALLTYIMIYKDEIIAVFGTWSIIAFFLVFFISSVLAFYLGFYALRFYRSGKRTI